MCQRSSLSPDSVADEPPTRGGAGSEQEKPCRKILGGGALAASAVVNTLDRVMSGAKSTSPNGNVDVAQRATSPRGPALSVIVPLYNEQESVGPLYQAIVQAVDRIGLSYEMVFVDDGSGDDTVAIAASIARRDPRLRIVKFRRNYGQTAAMAAGI